MVTTICNLFLWRLLNVTMVEITQEFLKEHLEYRDGHLWWAKLCLKYIEFGGGTEILHQDFKQVAKEAWNASRQNMTTGDI